MADRVRLHQSSKMLIPFMVRIPKNTARCIAAEWPQWDVKAGTLSDVIVAIYPTRDEGHGSFLKPSA
ncbi:hypothetical protein N7468_002958 [Penicillium chermesinum]|uniref:Uncharacterized protein n=1 Tax=Penicillium chermesinum TaxID=63820 RepID=A0A9W9P5K7_9EURO|nr:uncharacterized protein N7468_002958 [Penicillium chermesinum]KAJ5238339.1 hypothetical protein N7468_002958 [Penicillium chermesinum]